MSTPAPGQLRDADPGLVLGLGTGVAAAHELDGGAAGVSP